MSCDKISQALPPLFFGAGQRSNVELLRGRRESLGTRLYQTALDKLKELLVSAPVLAYPRFGLGVVGVEFILETDASGVGIGAVLSQTQDDEQLHPIAFASRSLDSSDRNYGITELETLAIVWAAHYFRPYLLGHHTTIFTDHSACVSVLGTARPSGKMARWASTIQELLTSRCWTTTFLCKKKIMCIM